MTFRSFDKIATVMLTAAFLAGCVNTSPPFDGTVQSQNAPAPLCSLSVDDQAWLDRSVAAWRYAAEEITEAGLPDEMLAVFFSADCTLMSETAMARGDAGDVTWSATPHDGIVTLPNGEEMPAVVTSFSNSNDDQSFFVMSTPSIWREGGVDGGALGLERLMTAAMLHEGMHVSQIPTYGVKITDLIRQFDLPESFNDDSVQEAFESNEAFAASVRDETALFLAASYAANDGVARQLAQQAYDKLRARHQRWFTAEYEYMSEAEDLWLTLEGSGQWVGYQWLLDPHGGGASVKEAMPGFGTRSKWWTQNEGLALFLAIDRLGYDWKSSAFTTGDMTALELLDAALAETS